LLLTTMKAVFNTRLRGTARFSVTARQPQAGISLKFITFLFAVLCGETNRTGRTVHEHDRRGGWERGWLWRPAMRDLTPMPKAAGAGTSRTIRLRNECPLLGKGGHWPARAQNGSAAIETKRTR
jgi:hypothetical protein